MPVDEMDQTLTKTPDGEKPLVPVITTSDKGVVDFGTKAILDICDKYDEDTQIDKWNEINELSK